LRQVLAAYLGEEPGQIRLGEGEHGKPRLEGPSKRLEFNLSHSGEIALVAVSGEHPVGVDVERVRPRRGQAFHQRWACHEARIKCLGVGLLRARQMALEPVAAAPFDVGGGYVAAIAVAANRLPPLRGWTFEPARLKTAGGVS
jgi:phosphopantetheinyl transferase